MTATAEDIPRFFEPPARFAIPRHRLACAIVLCLAALIGTSCSVFEPEERIPLTRDLRVYAAQARVRMTRLSPRQRAAVAPALRAHEEAIGRYDRLMVRGQTRLKIQAPLIATGAFLLADDVTGFGVADDVVIPFLALAAVAASLGTDAPASSKALKAAYQNVLDTAKDVSRALESSPVDTSSSTDGEAEAGTRQTCIDGYVDCQQNSHRSFPRSRCQACMDLCMGGNYTWPVTNDCDYRKTRNLRPRPPKVRW